MSKMTRAEAGRLGGLRTKQLYGSEHYRRIGRMGAQTFWERYTLFPVARSNFFIIRRDTGEYVSSLNGSIVRGGRNG